MSSRTGGAAVGVDFGQRNINGDIVRVGHFLGGGMGERLKPVF